MTVTFQAQLDDRGGAKEISCRKVMLITQEMSDDEIKNLVVAHGQVVTVTITY